MKKKLCKTLLLAGLAVIGSSANAEFYNPNANYTGSVQQNQASQYSTPVSASTYVVASPVVYPQGTYGSYYQQKYGVNSSAQYNYQPVQYVQPALQTHQQTQMTQPTTVITPYYPDGTAPTNYSTTYSQNSSTGTSSDSVDRVNDALNTVNSTINLINTFKSGW